MGKNTHIFAFTMNLSKVMMVNILWKKNAKKVKPKPTYWNNKTLMRILNVTSIK